MKMFKRIIQTAWSQVHKHAVLKPAEKLPSLAGSSDARVNSGTNKIISYFPLWIWSMLGSASLEKIERSCVFCSKNRTGKWKMPPTVANSVKAGWGKCVVPTGWGSRQLFLPHYLLRKAVTCLVESRRTGSLASLLAEVVNNSHWARLENSLSGSPCTLGSPLSNVFQALELLFRGFQRRLPFHWLSK